MTIAKEPQNITDFELRKGVWKITTLKQNMLDIPKLIIRILLLFLLLLLNFYLPCHAQNKLLATEKVSFVKSLFYLNH